MSVSIISRPFLAPSNAPRSPDHPVCPPPLPRMDLALLATPVRCLASWISHREPARRCRRRPRAALCLSRRRRRRLRRYRHHAPPQLRPPVSLPNSRTRHSRATISSMGKERWAACTRGRMPHILVTSTTCSITRNRGWTRRTSASVSRLAALPEDEDKVCGERKLFQFLRGRV